MTSLGLGVLGAKVASEHSLVLSPGQEATKVITKPRVCLTPRCRKVSHPQGTGRSEPVFVYVLDCVGLRFDLTTEA